MSSRHSSQFDKTGLRLLRACCQFPLDHSIEISFLSFRRFLPRVNLTGKSFHFRYLISFQDRFRDHGDFDGQNGHDLGKRSDKRRYLTLDGRIPAGVSVGMFMWMIGIPGSDARIANAAVKCAGRRLLFPIPGVCRLIRFRDYVNGT